MGIVFGKTGVSEPSFEMLLSRATASFPYELRRYGVRYAIETEFKAGGGDGNGFRALAGYIGVGTTPQNEGSVSIAMTAPVVTDNVKGEKIAMTAPVVTSSDEIGSATEMKKMQFILPEEYDDMSKIPKPTNPNVVVKKVPAAVGAVHTFTGFVKDAKAKNTATALAKQLQQDGVDTTGEEVLKKYDLWQFHPPFTLGPLRRNEIWVELTPKQVDELLKKFKEENQ